MLHLRVRGEELGQRQAVGVVLLPSAARSVLVPRSTSHESNGLRMAPGGVLHELQPLDVVVAHGDDDAADAVAVAVQILGRAVGDQIGAELDRPLDVRAGEGVVDDQPRAVPVRELGRGGAGR